MSVQERQALVIKDPGANDLEVARKLQQMFHQNREYKDLESIFQGNGMSQQIYMHKRQSQAGGHGTRISEFGEESVVSESLFLL